MKTQVHERRPGSTLTDAYVGRTDPRVRELFPYHPLEAGDWERRAAQLDDQAGNRANREALGRALTAYNRSHGASSQTLQAIERLAGGALAIVGGQQAGLWGGPLMVIHKAVTIIAAARDAERRLGRPVVPVFWIAGEDHDWEEASHTYVPEDGKLRKLAVDRPAGPRTSVSQTPLAPDVWERELAALAAALPDTALKPELLTKLQSLTARARTMSDQQAAILAWLFASEGLVLLDADDRALRQLEAPMLQRMLADNGELEEAYTAAASDVSAWGYALQAEAEHGSANLFYYRKETLTPERSERIKLYRTAEGFADRRGLIRLTADEALAQAADAPERFSNNVLSRPIMQDYLLPVLAAVLGPGEIAYWGIIGRAFRLMGMEMPLVLPRMSFTLIDETSAKHMEKYDLTLDDIIDRFEARRDGWLAKQDESRLEARFEETKRQLLALYEPLLGDVTERMPGLAGLAAKNRELLGEQVEFMRRRVLAELERRHEVSLRQLDRLRLMLHPGAPQERVLNFAPYWSRYGDEWLRQLLAVPYDPSGRHRLVYL